MSSCGSAPAKIREAATEINRVTDLWDATDIQRIDECRQALEHATTTMREAHEILVSNAGGAAEVGIQAMAIKARARQLERLVDAASALLRTASPDSTGCAPVYGCAGTIAFEPVSAGRGVEA